MMNIKNEPCFICVVEKEDVPYNWGELFCVENLLKENEKE